MNILFADIVVVSGSCGTIGSLVCHNDNLGIGMLLLSIVPQISQIRIKLLMSLIRKRMPTWLERSFSTLLNKIGDAAANSDNYKIIS